METNMLFKFFVQYFVFFFILVWYVYHIVYIEKKPFVRIRHPDMDVRKKVEHTINVILIITVFLFYVFVGFNKLYLQTKDIPILCSGDYEYIEGIVLNTAAERRYSSHYNRFLSKTIVVGDSMDSTYGIEIYIPNNANKGEHVKCHYLPNSHFGYIE